MQLPDQLTELLDSERGVSPVIGVILMVAITVILAAVIGSFVLNIGGSQEVTPQASIGFDFDDDDDELTIIHNGGDPIDESQLSLSVVGDGSVVEDSDPFDDAGGDDSAFQTGDSVTVDINNGDISDASSGDQIQVVYTSDSGQGSVLASFTIPSGADI